MGISHTLEKIIIKKNAYNYNSIRVGARLDNFCPRKLDMRFLINVRAHEKGSECQAKICGNVPC